MGNAVDSARAVDLVRSDLASSRIRKEAPGVLGAAAVNPYG
jgi:hypothetical protein